MQDLGTWLTKSSWPFGCPSTHLGPREGPNCTEVTIEDSSHPVSSQQVPFSEQEVNKLEDVKGKYLRGQDWAWLQKRYKRRLGTG
jgi:hypothetical protein